MLPHHFETVEKVKAHFRADPSALAVLLTGSIAHGFESAASDVDIAIVISEEDFATRMQPAPTLPLKDGATSSNGGDQGQTPPEPAVDPTGKGMHFFNQEMAAYEGGYVDGKYTTLAFIRDVAARGSEPARFAFAGAKVLLCREDTPNFRAELDAAVRDAATYPVAQQRERVTRFLAQLEAWRWYAGEALRQNNTYLLRVAVSKLILFGGRLVLAHNRALYPYHKWFMRVLADVSDKPEGMLEAIDKLEAEPTLENVEGFYAMTKGWRAWEQGSNGWPAQFMVDSELNWMDGSTPVDDL
jgi:hypothetical protein